MQAFSPDFASQDLIHIAWQIYYRHLLPLGAAGMLLATGTWRSG